MFFSIDIKLILFLGNNHIVKSWHKDNSNAVINLQNAKTYYVQHEVVTQTRCTVNPDQDAIFQGGAEANGQPVRPGARPLTGWPGECNEASSFAKDVRRPGWKKQEGVYTMSSTWNNIITYNFCT